MSVEEEQSRERKLTMAEYIENFDTLLALLNDEIDKRSRRKGESVRLLQRIRKSVTGLRTSARWVSRNGKRQPPAINGLDVPIRASDELLSFLKVNHDDKLTRLDITRALCVYCHLSPTEEREETLRWKYLNEEGRDLRDPTNRQKLLPDDALKTLLRYEKYVEDVEDGKIIAHRRNRDTGEREEYTVSDPSLTYFRLQYLIREHISSI